MKTKQDSMRWLGLALACGTLAIAGTTLAGKPVKPPPPPSTPPYVPVALGGLRSSDGVLNNFASDINNAGQVVGNTSLPDYESGHNSQAYLLNPRDTNGDGKPDTWFADVDSDGQNDLIIGLGTFPTTCGTCNRHSFATAVNDLGMVAGTSSVYEIEPTQGAFIVVPKDTNNDGQPDCWYEDVNGDGFNDLMMPLGRPADVPVASSPTELNINNQGQIVGWYSWEEANGTYFRAGFVLTPGAGVWCDDGGTGVNALMTSLNGFLPKSINDSGLIAGMTEVRTAMLRTPDGLLIDLKPGGSVSEAISINNRGQIGIWWQVNGVGHAGLLTPLDADGNGIADTWCQDSNGDGINDLIVDLGSLKGLENSYVRPNSLNETGSVLGGSWHAGRDGLGWNRAAWLWQNGVLQSLKSLTGIEFGDAYAINDARQIIAEASGRAFDYENGRTCILVPTR